MYYSFFFILITLHFYFFPFQFLFLGICVHVTRESPVFPSQSASLPVFPTPLLMLCTESCVCCHTALRHCRYEWRLIQGGAVISDCNLCLARLLCAVLNVIDCLLLGSFPWICHSELWVLLGTPKQSCGSLVGHLAVSALVFLSAALP